MGVLTKPPSGGAARAGEGVLPRTVNSLSKQRRLLWKAFFRYHVARMHHGLYSHRYVTSINAAGFSLLTDVTMPAELNAEYLASQTSILSGKVREHHPWRMPYVCNLKNTPRTGLLKGVMWSVLKFYAKCSWWMPGHGISLLLRKYFWKS